MIAGDAMVDIQGDIEAYLTNLGVDIDKELVQALLDAALHAEGEIKQAIMEVFKSGGTGQLTRNPKATLLEVEGEIKSSGAFLDLVYADIQDRGGEIRAKSVKNLSIPLSPEAKVPGKWPRTWAKDSLMYLKNRRSGKKLLVASERIMATRGKRKGKSYLRPVLKGEKLQAHYLLKKSVTIKGQGYLERARRAAEKGIAEIIGHHVQLSIDHTEMPA